MMSTEHRCPSNRLEGPKEDMCVWLCVFVHIYMALNISKRQPGREKETHLDFWWWTFPWWRKRGIHQIICHTVLGHLDFQLCVIIPSFCVIHMCPLFLCKCLSHTTLCGCACAPYWFRALAGLVVPGADLLRSRPSSFTSVTVIVAAGLVALRLGTHGHKHTHMNTRAHKNTLTNPHAWAQTWPSLFVNTNQWCVVPLRFLLWVLSLLAFFFLQNERLAWDHHKK